MNKKYELVVKGINNYGDKVTVTVKPEGDGQASLLLPDVAIRSTSRVVTNSRICASGKSRTRRWLMVLRVESCRDP